MMLLVIPQQDQGLLNGLIRPITKCKAMVVELASRDDPDKSVGPTRELSWELFLTHKSGSGI